MLTPEKAGAIATLIKRQFGKNEERIIDITKLAEAMGCTVFEVEFDQEDVSGTIVKEGDSFIIKVSRNETEGRKRFTIAHELAHYILHSAEFNEGKTFVSYRRAVEYYAENGTRGKEIEANLLAACLLMDEEQLREVYNQSPDIEKLALLFNVSRKAMTVRLESLNLL